MESYPLGRSPLFLGQRPSDDNKLHLYSPLYNRTFSLATSPEVLDIFTSPESHILYSKDGWLVFLKYDEPVHPAIVFVNPLLSSSPAVIKWRMPKYCFSTTTVSMSAPPSDPACIFLLMNCLEDGIEIITSNDGGRNWNIDFFRQRHNVLNAKKFDCVTNLVFHSGMFYCLDINGALGIYNPHRRTWVQHYMSIATKLIDQCTLVESDGMLLGVFRSSGYLECCEPSVYPIVYKLNEVTMEWEVLMELQGRALFLDEKSAILDVAETEGMKDRIFYSNSNHITEKADSELHRLTGSYLSSGNPWLVPKPHIGLVKLMGISHSYSLDDESIIKKSHHYFFDASYDQYKSEKLEAEEEDNLEREQEAEEELEADKMFPMWMRLGIWVQPNWGG